MGIREKLMAVQQGLNVPKSNYNEYGGFNYRSCENILESVKPLLKENGLVLTITDDIVMLGDRFYVKATAILSECETGESVMNSAFAREQETKKGMDASQITGSASSYARKYALNGLFCIDDVKDADTRDNREEGTVKRTEVKMDYIDDIKVRSILDRANADGVNIDKLCKLYKVSSLEHITEKGFVNINNNWEKIKERCRV